MRDLAGLTRVEKAVRSRRCREVDWERYGYGYGYGYGYI
jgi:hypothetical protein